MKTFLKQLAIIVMSALIGINCPCLSKPTDSIHNYNTPMALVKAVYKEKIKEFIKFKNQSNKDTIVAYYKRFFIEKTANQLADTIINNRGRSGDGAFYEDPRFSDDLKTGDPEDPWINDADRKIMKITYYTKNESEKSAVINVDSMVESKKGREMRSVFHIIKTTNGWKISNITWGPKGEFEEGSTLGLRSID